MNRVLHLNRLNTQYLLYWARISTVAMVFVLMCNALIYSFFDNPLPGNPFSGSVQFLINWVGVIFGFPGFIFWIAGKSLYRDRSLAVMLILGVGVYWALFLRQGEANHQSVYNLASILSVIGVATLISFLYLLLPNSQFGKQRLDEGAFNCKSQFLFASIMLLLAIATNGALRLISVVLPNTMDFDVHQIDVAFGSFAAIVFKLYQNLPAFGQTLFYVAYDLLPIVLFCTVGLAIREHREMQLHIYRVWLLPFLLAFLLYCIMPVSGPIYAFTATYYPYHMDMVDFSNIGAQFILPAARNGMPSMHFTGAIFIVLVAMCLSRKIFFYAAMVFALLTFFATMALGEHYLLDLIVAVPFALALGTALLNPPNWHFWQRKCWWGSLVFFLLWACLLLFARKFLIENPLFVQIFSLCSIAVSLYCGYQFFQIARNLPTVSWSVDVADTAPAREECKQNTSLRWVFILFIASGFAGLLYEVVFAKQLGVIFGGTSLAAYTVMGTYMGGMALGAWIGGWIADRVLIPLKYYAIFEGCIGAYAILTPFMFHWIADIYVFLAQDIRPDAGSLTVWRVVLGAAVLGVPTVLMGTTLPIMFKHLRQYLPNSGQVIANLYTANIIGAAMGALLGGYFVLPVLGISGATKLAALLSFMIALYAIEKLKQTSTVEEKDNPQITQVIDVEHVSAKSNIVSDVIATRSIGLAALCLVTVGGMVTLALEIVNMHMLSVVAGNSVYAFGLMLATFLMGLGIGSFSYERLRRYLSDPIIAASAQFGIFLSIVFTALMWDSIADYFASFGNMMRYHFFGFGARELIRAVVCAIIMMPPAFFIGLGYPATMSLSANWLKDKDNDKEASGVGIASLFNTGGNIIGVLLAGFVLLNWLGSNKLLLLLAVVSLCLSCLMFIVISRSYLGKFNVVSTALAIGVSAVAVLSLYLFPSQWNWRSLSNGANVYFQPINWGDVVDHAESIEGGLTTVNKSGEQYTLLTNGKFQGNNSGEVDAQRAVALIPLLHTPARDNVLVIGYGTGSTAHTFHERGFKQIDIAELSRDIVSLADKYFGENNGYISKDKDVTLYYTDGRNYLLTQSKQYDLISLEISSIWFAGAANLYNREFYALAKKRLKPNGVLQQWVQLHHIKPIDLFYIINTINQEFDNVWLYVSGGQGILVASDAENANAFFDLDGHPFDGWENLTTQEKKLYSDNLLSPEDIDHISKKLVVPEYFISTDDNLYLEYATPKGNALSYDALQYNIDLLNKLKEN